MKIRILDLYCGAGGAAVGYHRAFSEAGFEVESVGVDNASQKRYPFAFVQDDALAYTAAYGWSFDFIHASPPCQRYSVTKVLPQCDRDYPDLLAITRYVLISIGKPYVIENVIGAPMPNAITLCGLMFGLKVFRHRRFESNLLLFQPGHLPHAGKRIGVDGYCCVVGNGDAGRNIKVDAFHWRKSTWQKAMGIDWMTKRELTQAIPPAYTEYIGRQLALYFKQRHVEPEPEWNWRQYLEAAGE